MTERPRDPPIDEIRAIREKISEQFHHDAAALIAHYRKLEEQYQGRLVDRSEDQERDQHAA